MQTSQIDVMDCARDCWRTPQSPSTIMNALIRACASRRVGSIRQTVLAFALGVLALQGCGSLGGKPAPGKSASSDASTSTDVSASTDARRSVCVSDSIFAIAIRTLRRVDSVYDPTGTRIADSSWAKLLTSSAGTTSIISGEMQAANALEVEATVSGAMGETFESRVPVSVTTLLLARAYGRMAGLMRAAAFQRDSSLRLSNSPGDSARHEYVRRNVLDEAEALTQYQPKARLHFAALYNSLYANRSVACP